LYGYSAFGMPVSTTACLVFELLGASFALGGPDIVEWDKAGTVVFAIVCSIFISGVAGFVVQRALRGAIRDRSQSLQMLLLHGGWAGGGMLAGLAWFMLTKGMAGVDAVQNAYHAALTRLANVLALAGGDSPPVAFAAVLIACGLWAFFAILVHASLVIWQARAARWVFPVIAVIGMICMGFAFGQNDLANCASPGLASYNLFQHRDAADPVAKATRVDVSQWLLLGCGVLLLLGMTTQNAQRVTRAAVHTGSMAHNVALWAPRWCLRLARRFMRLRGQAPTLAPAPAVTSAGKRMHYDALRACVILTVSASVIATASSLGLPVSTTYVAFAAVVATGAADRILQRGDADLKLARTIWVIFSWFASAVIAAVGAGLICLLVYHLGVVGTLAGVAMNLALRRRLKRSADAQDQRVREQARDRAHPEEFTEFEG
jgi:phosphate/sulfate permease